MGKLLSKKKTIIIALIFFLVILFFVFLKFFLNVMSCLIASIVIVVALTVWVLYFLKKKDVIELDSDFLKDNWFLVLFSMVFCFGTVCCLLLLIENIPPEKTIEIIQAQRLSDEEITKRVSCDSVQRFVKHDESLDTIKHYRYYWGIMRNHDDTITHKNPVFAYTFLNQEYSLMQETVVDGYKIKCGEKILVDVQEKYFEGSKSKPFTRFVIVEYNEKGVRKYSEYENEPQSENRRTDLYDLFFDGAWAQWYDTISVPKFDCTMPASSSIIQQISETLGFRKGKKDCFGIFDKNGNLIDCYFSTQTEAFAYCDEICKNAADKLFTGFNYTEYKTCLSTINVYQFYEQVEHPCGTAEITINRKRGFLSRKPYSCNSTGTWKMVKN